MGRRRRKLTGSAWDDVSVEAPLVPEQMHLPRPRTETPELKLMLAVVEQALLDSLGENPIQRADAVLYFRGGPLMPSGAIYPFAWERACEEFDWEPDYIERLMDRLQPEDRGRLVSMVSHSWRRR